MKFNKYLYALATTAIIAVGCQSIPTPEKDDENINTEKPTSDKYCIKAEFPATTRVSVEDNIVSPEIGSVKIDWESGDEFTLGDSNGDAFTFVYSSELELFECDKEPVVGAYAAIYGDYYSKIEEVDQVGNTSADCLSDLILLQAEGELSEGDNVINFAHSKAYIRVEFDVDFTPESLTYRENKEANAAYVAINYTEVEPGHFVSYISTPVVEAGVSRELSFAVKGKDKVAQYYVTTDEEYKAGAWYMVNIAATDFEVTSSVAPTIELVSTTPTSIVVNMAKSESSLNYFLALYGKANFEEQYAANPKDCAQALATYYKLFGMNFAKADNETVFNKDVDNFDISTVYDLDPDTEYVVMVCGVTAEGVVATEVNYVDATTEPLPASEITLDVLSHTAEDITLNITAPEDENYVVALALKSSYVDEGYASAEEFIAHCVYVIGGGNGSVGQFDPAVVDDKYIFSGSNECYSAKESWQVYPESEYVIVAATLNAVGKCTSEAVKIEVTTDKVIVDANLVSITASDVDASSALINVDAGIYNGNYALGIFSQFRYDLYFDENPNVAAEKMIGVWQASGEVDPTIVDNINIFSGNLVDYDIAAERVILPNTEYCIVVCGIGADFEITTEVMECRFTTDEYAIPSDFKIEVEATNVTGNYADITITPSDLIVPYVYSLSKYETVKSWSDSDIQQAMAYGAVGTNGVSHLFSDDLEPETEYIVISMAMNGNYVTGPIFKSFFTTGSEVQPKAAKSPSIARNTVAYSLNKRCAKERAMVNALTLK